MKRKIIEKFLVWKRDHIKKPLMLLGARQVGKTFILNQFCQQYFQSYLYINLERDEEIRAIFESTLNPKEIINSISILKNMEIKEEETVLFIDEIGESSRAIQSLKYFCELEKPYFIVCAGSVLGVNINKMKTSFPVGKVYRLYLSSLDFEEFLSALNEEKLSLMIQECFSKNRKMLEPLHKKALNLYKIYLYIGGMPESIKEFLRAGKRLNGYNENILYSILEDYLADMNRYATPTEASKIHSIYKSIPSHLGREHSKFTYKLVNSKANKRYLKTALEWLEFSYIIQKSFLCQLPQTPLTAYYDTNYFKIYASDVGLLSRLANFNKKDLFTNHESIFSGMLAENFVANTLKNSGFELCYWTSKNNAEVDFILNIDGNIIPVEVKASLRTKSKSLSVYMQKYNPQYALRISSKNFGQNNNIKSIPLYATHLIRNR